MTETRAPERVETEVGRLRLMGYAMAALVQVGLVAPCMVSAALGIGRWARNHPLTPLYWADIVAQLVVPPIAFALAALWLRSGRRNRIPAAIATVVILPIALRGIELGTHVCLELNRPVIGTGCRLPEWGIVLGGMVLFDACANWMCVVGATVLVALTELCTRRFRRRASERRVGVGGERPPTEPNEL